MNRSRREVIRGRLLALAMAALVGLAACTGGGGDDERAGRDRPSAARATEGDQPPALPCDPAGGITVAPPAEGIYTGVYAQGVDIAAHPNPPDKLRDGMHAYTELAGRRPAWGVILDIWFDGKIEFPAEHARTVWKDGAVPRLAMSPMSDWQYAGTPDPVFPMQDFIAGRFDAELTRYASDARASGIPLAASFGGEVTGGWPWSGQHNGGGRTTGYGDPEWPDGPERYRDAFRHVIDVFRDAGATNVTWMFQVGLPWPGDPDWNTNRWYYPGDDYIDWIGTSLYGAYPGLPESFPAVETMDTIYEDMTALSDTKPLAIIEMGTTEHDDLEKAAWIRDGFEALRAGRWPRVKLVIWWHEYSEDENGNDASTAIDSTKTALAAYRDAISDATFVETPAFECGGFP